MSVARWKNSSRSLESRPALFEVAGINNAESDSLFALSKVEAFRAIERGNSRGNNAPSCQELRRLPKDMDTLPGKSLSVIKTSSGLKRRLKTGT